MPYVDMLFWNTGMFEGTLEKGRKMSDPAIMGANCGPGRLDLSTDHGLLASVLTWHLYEQEAFASSIA
jgi:hypothetical protein